MNKNQHLQSGTEVILLLDILKVFLEVVFLIMTWRATTGVWGHTNTNNDLKDRKMLVA